MNRSKASKLALILTTALCFSGVSGIGLMTYQGEIYRLETSLLKTRTFSPERPGAIQQLNDDINLRKLVHLILLMLSVGSAKGLSFMSYRLLKTSDR